jgi:hypothetical protein
VDPDIIAPESSGWPSDVADDKSFQLRVLNFISGEGEQEPTNVGPSVDWSLFNKTQDNTWLMIHTPSVLNWNRAQGHDKQYAMYGNKMAAIANLVKKKIPGVQTQLHLYRPLNYWTEINLDGTTSLMGPDAARVDVSALGYNVFQ